MNDALIEHIDKKLKSGNTQSLEQLVYILAKLSLVSSPVAWMVRSVKGKEDIPCITRANALRIMQEHGDEKSYVLPLYTLIKADIILLNNIPTLNLSMRPIRKH